MVSQPLGACITHGYIPRPRTTGLYPCIPQWACLLPENDIGTPNLSPSIKGALSSSGGDSDSFLQQVCMEL